MNKSDLTYELIGVTALAMTIAHFCFMPFLGWFWLAGWLR